MFVWQIKIIITTISNMASPLSTKCAYVSTTQNQKITTMGDKTLSILNGLQIKFTLYALNTGAKLNSHRALVALTMDETIGTKELRERERR